MGVVAKLQVGEVLECSGEPKSVDGGVPRSQCKILSSGLTGWVTVKGNQGTTYLDPVSPFQVFTKELDASLVATAKSNGKVTAFFITKNKEIHSPNKDSPLQEARDELAKLRSTVSQ